MSHTLSVVLHIANAAQRRLPYLWGFLGSKVHNKVDIVFRHILRVTLERNYMTAHGKGLDGTERARGQQMGTGRKSRHLVMVIIHKAQTATGNIREAYLTNARSPTRGSTLYTSA